uniref:Transposon TX1 uncharacterized n=1 Tax=Cajanus cajan TaxID=3821 RepID=A0A151U3Z3_CAJCA|nr:Transposon TX1 uncharacterized [Cajanus cajan]
MHSNKSPGPDGLNPGFYKRFWNLLRSEVFQAGVQWLNQGSFPTQLTKTNVAFIPKKDNPTSMKDLRLISLSNVIYKVISKVLANRMKPLMAKYISNEQSAFVEHRSILDNVLLAIETIHHMKCKKQAFDRVNWAYLQALMLKLGFHSCWDHWMKICMESTQYIVQLNGEETESINPARSLGLEFLIYTNAIVTRVFKAKYFPKGDFLAATLGHNPSFVWHSIFASRVLAKEGIRVNALEVTLVSTLGAIPSYEDKMVLCYISTYKRFTPHESS